MENKNSNKNIFTRIFRIFSKALWWISTPKEIPARISFLLKKYKTSKKKIYYSYPDEKILPKDVKKWGIVASPHTLFVAELLAHSLSRYNYNVEIYKEMPTNFTDDMYIVICPQMFNVLPPFSRLISFQMEQAINSHWINLEYLNILKKSYAVLDYSLINIKFLEKEGLEAEKIYYLPIGAIKEYKTLNPVKKEDYILFYGDSLSCPRRHNLLRILKKNFNIKIINNLFGEDIKNEISKAILVINLHYNKDSLLETTRIQECLSLGTPVVSETAIDIGDYPELDGAVRFFNVGNITEMINTISEALRDIDLLQINILNSVDKSESKFSYNFDQFLVSFGIINSNKTV